MKKTVKFFALAAIILAASCTKEINPTDTPSASGNDFTASFEAVKTTLDNYTPKWVAGDAIGITTSADANVKCDIKDVDKGTFKADDIQGSAPYYAVYPYNAGNTFSDGVLTATVPSSQQLVSGSPIAPGAMVAACKSESKTLAFKNCVGLLKITIPTTDVKKVVVASTTKGEKIAGKFTMDLSEETLAPVAASEDVDSTVTLLPAGEAFAAGTYYVAVIPNAISSFKITFTNTDDEEVVVTKSTSLALARNKCIDLGSFFTYRLTSATEMIKWAKQSAKFTTWDYVTVENDITFTSDSAALYVEANKFCGIFDGQNHKITGLTTAIFGDLQGTVKNLEVESNIVTDLKKSAQRTGSYTYGTGIIAHYFKKELNTDAYVDNVITRGSVKISGGSVANSHQIGGLAGASNGVTVTNCKNYATVEIDGISYSKTGNCVAGGCIGTIQNNATTYKNFENYGTVTVKNVTGNSSPVIAGGVFGYNTQASTIDSLKNHAAVSVGGTFKGTFTYKAIGGVIGNNLGTSAKPTVTNCSNDAAVVFDADMSALSSGTGYAYVGGVLGNSDAAITVTDCSNSGDVTNNSLSTMSSNATQYLGGCIGRIYANATVSDCTNSGEVIMSGDLAAESDAAGIAGCFYTGTLTGCTNTGAVSNTMTNGKAIVMKLGGIVANAICTAPSKDLKSTTTISSCNNEGEITCSSPVASTSAIAGIVANAGQYIAINDCSNTKAISSSPATTNTYLAGILGSTTNGFNVYKCSNSGSVTNTGTVKTLLRFGGIVGNGSCGTPVSGATTPYGKIDDCDNSGAIVNSSATTSAPTRLGGILGSSTNGATYVLNSDNRGDILNTVTNEATLANAQLGGIAAYMGNVNGKIDLCTTKSTVSSTGTVTTCYAAAVLGQCGTGGNFTLSNTKLAGTISGSTVTTTNGTVTSENYASHIYAYKATAAPLEIDTCSFLNE